MLTNTIGWDIGGAHLKAAVINHQGEILDIFQQPCPLWKGLDQLQHALNIILSNIENALSSQHAITMTGELVDLFADRHDGVKQIIDTLGRALSGAQQLIFVGHGGFVPAQQLTPEHYDTIASANWLASATLAAHYMTDGLFVDIGSTTTDILLLQNKRVLAQGYNDYQRLQSQELLYTGIIRTAVMAVTRSAQDQGQTIGLMAEYFATMADVYRLTAELNEAHDQTDTADGAEKTITASARRLARMVGCDLDNNDLPRWQNFAKNIRHQQLHYIQQGCQVQLRRSSHISPPPLIGAGVGRFLVRAIAANLGHTYVDFSSLLPRCATPTELSAADCAPAVAVAYLAKQLPSFSIV